MKNERLIFYQGFYCKFHTSITSIQILNGSGIIIDHSQFINYNNFIFDVHYKYTLQFHVSYSKNKQILSPLINLLNYEFQLNSRTLRQFIQPYKTCHKTCLYSSLLKWKSHLISMHGLVILSSLASIDL